MLRTVCEFNKCAGCMACIDICPKEAIQIQDSLKAYNAVIDESKCIDCNLCLKICQRCNPPILKLPFLWKEGWAEDPAIREASSSGGFASAIEISFVRNGGIVYSCTFDDGEFKFSSTDEETDIGKFAGSKYVKSNPIGVYKKMVKHLKDGKKVLFVGLPCQVAAARNYVGDRENFYAIDLICHGTPSPKILEAFLNEHECTLRSLKDLSFRIKSNFGLKHYNKSFTIPIVRDNYTTTFLNSTTYTENCYECGYAKLERISDLTLGDSWGSKLSETEARKGISLALCQTKKGWELLQQAKLHLMDLDLDIAVKNNHQLQYSSAKPSQREKFLNMIKSGKRFSYAMLRCYPSRYIKDVIKIMLFRMKIIGGGR